MTKLIKQIVVGGLVMVLAGKFAKLLDEGIDRVIERTKRQPKQPAAAAPESSPTKD